ncbi:MAG: Lrp/AsnC family transcriptional regulator [bacterium]|nr:Lrp/AsnC family transcriptional regulator [bacterium]
MNLKLNELIDKKLFLLLERGIPITERPFLEIGNDLNLSEETVLDKIKQFNDSGLIRRFGAIFDNPRLGYRSALCAVKVDGGELDRVSDFLKQRPEITHCYIRDYDINLWFTFSCLNDCFEKNINEIKEYLSPNKLLFLPALKRYKISVIFDLGIKLNDQYIPNTNLDLDDTNIFDDLDKQLIRNLRNIPITERPFTKLSNILNIPKETVLEKINSWKKKYVLKRISIIPYHYKIGYKSNAMCVWKIDKDDVEEIGKVLSGRKEITHLYERTAYPEFPYNIYAMVHGNSHKVTTEIFHNISNELLLNNGTILFSTKEIKKTSLELFA